MAETLAATPQQLAAAKKAVISSSIGAALEWFDIIVYATFAVVIAEHFFPESDGTIGLLLTFATFAISYVIRPLGGMVLGSYADRKGRKNALTLTLMLMMLGTLIMAVAPTYAQVGVWGAVIILISGPAQEGLLCLVAGCRTGCLDAAGFGLRLRVDPVVVPRCALQLGLARAVLRRSADRPGGPVHPGQAR